MRIDGARSRPTGVGLGRLAELAVERTGGAGVLLFEGHRQTSGELLVRARRLAGGLRAAGLRPGERVAVCMANCPEVTLIYQAVWRAGGVVTPVLFLLDVDELRHVLADSGAAYLVTTPEFLDRARAAAVADPAAAQPAAAQPAPGASVVGGPAGPVPAVRAIVLAGGPPPPERPRAGSPPVGAMSALADGAAPARRGPEVLHLAELETADEGPLVEVDPAGMAALLYTGGTTGRARGVELSHDGLSAGAWATMSGTADEGLVGLLPLPMSHVYGLTITVMAFHTRHPGLSVLMRWFSPREWLDLVVEHRVNASALVPSMVARLLAEPLHDYDLSSLGRVSSGGAPLARETALEWRRRLPGVELVEGYGCTESSGIIAATPMGGARLGSVGRPAPGVRVRIVLPDGSPAGCGQDGEICARGPMLMSGYWRAPEETAVALRDGWLHTGDVGRLDADGYLYVVDRMKDLIIRGGVNVYPRDVEDGLLAHPDVASCGVVGRPDPRHGEEVIAFVQLVPGGTVSPEELVRWGRARLGPIRSPRQVHIVDTLPVTSALKTDRRRLRALVASG